MLVIKIGIVINKMKCECTAIVEKLASAIQKEGAVPLYTEEDTYIFQNADILISIGGDGTFLKTAAHAVKRDIPVIGINLGTLGFLTEIEKNDIDNTVARLVRDDYFVEKRRVMDVTVRRNDSVVFRELALNDLVVARNILSKVLYLNVYINNIFVDTYPGDGVIIATQTGSTAYSLSAGGPIVAPGNDILIFTPLNVHMGDGRSIVLNRESDVTVKILKEHNDAYAVVDGHTSHRLSEDDTISCRLLDTYVKIIRMEEPDFYSVLKKKNSERRAKFCEI